MWPFVFAALSKAVSSGVNYVEQRQAGGAALKQGEMERALYGKNADLATQQAADAEARGQEAANRQTYKMRTLVGSQNANFAGQGVSIVGGGSPADVIRSDQALGEYDRQTILENARREAWGYQQQASIYRAQGDIAYSAGANRQKADNLESIGTMANFAGDMFGMFQGAGFGGGGGGGAAAQMGGDPTAED